MSGAPSGQSVAAPVEEESSLGSDSVIRPHLQMAGRTVRGNSLRQESVTWSNVSQRNYKQTHFTINKYTYIYLGPVHGRWSQWSAWSTCNRVCGTGNQTIERSCTNPSPAFEGRDCRGKNVRMRKCNIESCEGI